MDREYLEDYEQKEKEEYERFEKRIREGKFDFEKDRYPPDVRFVNLQKPVASPITIETAQMTNLWAQIPLCGSLILLLPPYPQSDFDEHLFKISQIPNVIDFIKETGKLQVALSTKPHYYEGLNHLDPFFKELNPPVFSGAPISMFGNEKEVRKATDTFVTLGRVRFLPWFADYSKSELYGSRFFRLLLGTEIGVYQTLKLGHYTVVEDIENLMIDDPEGASLLLYLCRLFIVTPLRDLRSNMANFTFEDIRATRGLPFVYQPREVQFPCEIGKFLLRKLTCAAQDMRACYNLMDDYNAYDLQRVQEALNEAIVTTHPDIISKNTEEFSEILDNIWNDPTIPKRTKNLRRGVPMSIAAVGTAVSAFTGGIEGFLAGLGFSVGAEFLKAEIEGVSERIAKFFARSYQANVYDFKKKYKDKIVKPRHQ